MDSGLSDNHCPKSRVAMSLRHDVPKKEIGRGRQKMVVLSADEEMGARDPLSASRVLARGGSQASRASWGFNRRRLQQHCSPPRRTAVAARRPPGTAPQTLDRKGKTASVLPQIKNGRGRAPGARGEPKKPIPDQEKSRPLPFQAGDMTPWVRPSPSETSFTTFLFSIPTHKPCCEDLLDPPDSPGTLQPVPRRHAGRSPPPLPAHQPPPREKSGVRAKERSRTGIAERYSLGKLYGIKLPPVLPVTDLSFSRNFSFSFFELPEHQSPQQWLQRQRLVHATMNELHRSR